MKNSTFFVVTQPSVLDINFDDLRARGVNCVLFDAEGTLTPWGGSVVSEDIRHAVKAAGIKKIGIISNMHREHIKRAEAIGAQVNASSVMVPLRWRTRKPSAFLVHASLRRLNSTPEHTVLIGDKLIDVLTAKNAGLAGAVWLDVLPGPDHWFDRNVYRKIEPRLKRRYTKRFQQPSNE